MPHAGRLRYEEHGPADAPPLILSAGFGGSGACWAPKLAALAKDHHVVAYDHRGAGRGDRAVPGTRLAGMKWGGHACNVTDPGHFNTIVRDFFKG